MLSVLLLPGGGGEDDIDIGGGLLVLVLGGGGVPVSGHGGGGGRWRVRWSSWLVSQLSQHVIKHTNCVRRKTIIKSTVIALILANIHLS